VVDYRAQTVVGEIHEPMLAAIESIDGLRERRDKIVSITEDAGCEGGCPLGSLGSELAELDHVTRDDVATGCIRWEAAIRPACKACATAASSSGPQTPASSPRPCSPRWKAGCSSLKSNAASSLLATRAFRLGRCDFEREWQLQRSVPSGTRRLCHPVRDRADDEPGEEWGVGERA
jgi:hypothetical protein